MKADINAPLCGRRVRSVRANVQRCALCPLLALCPALAAAQSQVSGVVRTANGAPVTGLAVDLVGTDYRTVTTDNGAYTLGRVAPGTYTIVAHGPTWLTSRAQITTTPGTDIRIDLVVTSIGERPTTASGIAPLPAVTVEGQRSTTTAYGAGVSANGANDYSVTASDIQNLPTGDRTPITDVLTRMPGVAIDQNQQIHIRNTEGPQFQYRINGALVPLDINTNPPFISMINPMFVSKLDLLDGILPSRYSYATGGVVDIQTKNGCDSPGGNASITFGQRETFAPSAQYAGCSGNVSYYVSGSYDQGQTAFSSATPGPNPVHNWTNQGQGFGYLSFPITSTTKLSVMLSTAASNNQLPNVPGLPAQFTLAGVTDFNSAAITSALNFRDYLGMVTLTGMPADDLSYQLTYSVHSIAQDFRPDNVGELLFQGVASTASHNDFDNTLQGDVTYKAGRHTVSAGFYGGVYHVIADDRSLVFPIDTTTGDQTSTTASTVVNNASALNILSGVYINDLWQIDDKLSLNVGLRWDDITGFTSNNQFDPTINLTYLLTPQTTLHGGFARYMQVPSLLGISPTAQRAFAGTTAAGPPGIATPLTEDDFEWDAGIVHRLTPKITVSEDAFYERTKHYLDTGQFGDVPIFAPFNYDNGFIWGSETSASYKGEKFSAYGSATIGNNLQKGVVTGQFNFDPDELTYINQHAIVLDHQPLYGASAGGTYKWRPLTFILDGIYSSGLRGGFADLDHLPQVVQFNGAIQGDFRIPGIGKVSDRFTVLNMLDRINLIRPAEGIGIFQSAYGPRITWLNTVSIAF
jgi:TonB-dependent receptor-like protein/carboxypeptidase family protein